MASTTGTSSRVGYNVRQTQNISSWGASHALREASLRRPTVTPESHDLADEKGDDSGSNQCKSNRNT